MALPRTEAGAPPDTVAVGAFHNASTALLEECRNSPALPRLSNACQVDEQTADLICVNLRYKAHAGVRVPTSDGSEHRD